MCGSEGRGHAEGHRMARNSKWKMVLTGTDEFYFFDLQNDPAELENRIHAPEL